MINIETKQQAQFLYMAQGKTQKEIADLVGVSERTIYAWIHQYAWDKLRLAAYQAPATIADNLCSQIVELQNTIAAREPGNRFSTQQEAEVIRKLITCLDKMKKSPSMGQNMQVLETFRNYMKPINSEFAKDLGRYSGQFLEAASVNGYAPYQLEYGVAPVSPVAPFSCDPDSGDEPAESNATCLDHANCLHAGDCKWPECHSNKTKKQEPEYNIPGIHYARQWAESLAAARHQPATTGSIPAILTTAVNQNTYVPAPEETGSNPAIAPLEKEIISIIEPVVAERVREEATGSNSAMSVPHTQHPPTLQKSGNHRKQFRNITRHLRATNIDMPLLSVATQCLPGLPSMK